MLGGDGDHGGAGLFIDFLERETTLLGDVGHRLRGVGDDQLSLVPLGAGGRQDMLLRLGGVGELRFRGSGGGQVILAFLRRFTLHLRAQIDEDGAAGQTAQEDAGQEYGSYPTAMVLGGTDVSGFIETAESLFLRLGKGGVFRLQRVFVIMEHKHCLAITDCLPRPG